MARFPSIFLSHGSPMMLLEDSPARRFLSEYGSVLGKPSAILVASAHWDSAGIAVSVADPPETIYDFYGFPEPMYRIRYAAPGAPDVARRAADLVRKAGANAPLDPRRGLDHGAWVPLILMYPDADVPVAQISIQSHLGARHHLALGAALAPLRDEGVLVVGSGNLTHGLRDMDRGTPEDAPYPWVTAFADWADDAIANGRADDLVDYRAKAPEAARNHPTEDHYVPLLVALGAGGPNATAERVHASTSYRTLAMDCYAFH